MMILGNIIYVVDEKTCFFYTQQKNMIFVIFLPLQIDSLTQFFFVTGLFSSKEYSSCFEIILLLTVLNISILKFWIMKALKKSYRKIKVARSNLNILQIYHLYYLYSSDFSIVFFFV